MKRDEVWGTRPAASLLKLSELSVVKPEGLHPLRIHHRWHIRSTSALLILHLVGARRRRQETQTATLTKATRRGCNPTGADAYPGPPTSAQVRLIPSSPSLFPDFDPDAISLSQAPIPLDLLACPYRRTRILIPFPRRSRFSFLRCRRFPVEAENLADILQRNAEVDGFAALLESDAQRSFPTAFAEDADGEKAAAVEDLLDRGGGDVGAGGEEVGRQRIFEKNADGEVGRRRRRIGGMGGGWIWLDGRGKGRLGWQAGFEDAKPAERELVRRGQRPGRGRVPFRRGQRRNGVDVDGGSDEEDALNGVGGQGGRVEEGGHEGGVVDGTG